MASDPSKPGSADSESSDVEGEAKEKQAASAYVVYRAITAEAKEELDRSSVALAWSGLAAGLSMGFSLVAEALLHEKLPSAPWTPLISKLGYSVGFLIVVLGRQQLFTENTLTPVLPLLRERTAAVLGNVLRLWVIVMVTNLIGTMIFAWVVSRGNAFEPEVKAVFIELSRQTVSPSAATILYRGVFAGWLIALMVWLLPVAETGRISVIVIITYLIGLGHFSHVIAGSTEAFYLAAAGLDSWGHALTHFVAPALVGNILGGTAMVAALNHAQATTDQPK